MFTGSFGSKCEVDFIMNVKLFWEITSDGTNTEFPSDNNCNFNFVKVQTSNRTAQAH